jgi:predicted phosphodiesterase
MVNMRLAVVSDVHGNLPALEAVLADIKRQQVDELIVAGDMVGCPQPQATLESLRDQGALMIRGNHENYYLNCDRGRTPTGSGNSKQWEAVQWAYEQLDRDALDFLTSLPEQRVITLGATTPIRVVHGSPSSDREHVFPDRTPAALTRFRQEDLLPRDQTPSPLCLVTEGVAEAVLVCGHSHIPWQQSETGCLVVNPGSAGLSINGDPRATYAILTWTGDHWSAEHRFITYDVVQLRRAYETTECLADGGAFARACLLASESGHNVALRLIRHTYRTAAAQGIDTSAGIPDENWDAAVAGFDWVRATETWVSDDR